MVFVVKTELPDTCKNLGNPFRFNLRVVCDVVSIDLSKNAVHVEQVILGSFNYVTQFWSLTVPYN